MFLVFNTMFLFLQDFFDKLNECIWSQKILPVFKLLAHALNSQVCWHKLSIRLK